MHGTDTSIFTIISQVMRATGLGIIGVNIIVLSLAGFSFWFRWLGRGLAWWTLMSMGIVVTNTVVMSTVHGTVATIITTFISIIFLFVVGRRWYRGTTQAWAELPSIMALRKGRANVARERKRQDNPIGRPVP